VWNYACFFASSLSFQTLQCGAWSQISSGMLLGHSNFFSIIMLPYIPMECKPNQIYLTVLTIPNNTIYMRDITTTLYGKHKSAGKERSLLHRFAHLPIQPKTSRPPSVPGCCKKRRQLPRPDRKIAAKGSQLCASLSRKTSESRPC